MFNDKKYINLNICYTCYIIINTNNNAIMIIMNYNSVA